MRRWKLSAAAVLFSMSAGLATIHAAGRDPSVGEYSMECPQAQCWLEIEKGKGKTYKRPLHCRRPRGCLQSPLSGGYPDGKGTFEFHRDGTA